MGITVMYVSINSAQLILVWNDKNIWVYCAEPYKNCTQKKQTIENPSNLLLSSKTLL
jgi:hypothetical protein